MKGKCTQVEGLADAMNPRNKHRKKETCYSLAEK
jgi:hypothetical protein